MPPTTTQPPSSATSGLSSIPADILDTYILTHLNGPTLASATCASTLFSAGRHHHHLWSTICHSTWPSTATDQIAAIISTFSDDGNGYRSFFSQSFPLPAPDPTTLPPPQPIPPSSSPADELISAVDIHYRNIPIFSKTEITETTGDWFQCSPFRIDLVDAKSTVATPIPIPTGEAACTELMEDVTLSWILIDAVNKRSVNLSSNKPVSVHRHWLSGEVQLRFVSILAGDGGEVVQCRIVVVCGVSEDGKMQLPEVTMEMGDMDGKCLNGRGSLVILRRAMEGKRGNGLYREDEARRRYGRYEEMMRERRDRRERKSRVEGTLDILSLGFGLSISVGLFFILISKKFILKKD